MTTAHSVGTVHHPRLSVRAIVTRLADRIHEPAETQARALGFTVRIVPGRLGWSSREYRHPLARRS